MPPRPRLCLLPGLLCDATVWAPQLSAFGGADDIYVPDFRGLDSFGLMAERVLLQTSGPLALAGHSMGARVAMEVWRRAPERVARLALLSTGAHGVRPGEAGPRMELVRLAQAEGMEPVARAWLPPMLHPDRRDDVALVEPLVRMIRRATPEMFEGQQQAGLTRRDMTAELAAVRVPSLVLCGRQDQWSPVAQHEALAAAIPGARLVIVEDCGHMATVERPQAVNLALAGWLAAPAP